MNRSKYQSEVCGLCQGKGTHPKHPCPACDGKGCVLVHQPALHCPRCGGNGRAKAAEESFYYTPLCIVCQGTGWVMTLPLQEGSWLGQASTL